MKQRMQTRLDKKISKTKSPNHLIYTRVSYFKSNNCLGAVGVVKVRSDVKFL